MTTEPRLRLFIALDEPSLAENLGNRFAALNCTVCGTAGKGEELLAALEDARARLHQCEA
jgi:hypothetical protein